MLPKITRPFCMEEKMKSRTKYISLVILVILALGLAACERSATQAPQEPLPTAESPGMEDLAQMLQTPEAGGEAEIVDVPENGELPFDPLAPMEGEQPAEDGQPTGEEAQPTVEEPAPAVNAPQAFTEPPRPGSYTLRKGEFPYCIARRFNVAPSELMSQNGLSAAQSRSLQPGLVLQIPQTGNPFPGPRALQQHPVGYIVQSGDTIHSIACKFGDVYPEHIAANNGLVENQSLIVGETLNIP
jgi:LysM repeat protein